LTGGRKRTRRRPAPVTAGRQPEGASFWIRWGRPWVARPAFSVGRWWRFRRYRTGRARRRPV